MKRFGLCLLLSFAGCGSPPAITTMETEAIRGGVKDVSNHAVVMLSTERLPCPVTSKLPPPPKDTSHVPDKSTGRRMGTCTGVVVGRYTILTAAHCALNKTRFYVQLPWVSDAKSDPTLVFDVVEANKVSYYPTSIIDAKKYIQKLNGLAGDFERTNVANTDGFASVYKVTEWADLAAIQTNKDLIAAGASAATLVDADKTPPPKKPIVLNIDIYGRRNPGDAQDDKTIFETKKGIDGKALQAQKSSEFPNYLVHEEHAPIWPKEKWIGPLCNSGDGGGPAFIQCDEVVVGGILSGMDLQWDAACGDRRRTFWVNLAQPPIHKWVVNRIAADLTAHGEEPYPLSPWQAWQEAAASYVAPPEWSTCTERPVGLDNPGDDDGEGDFADRDEEEGIAFAYDTAVGTDHPDACCVPQDD